MSVRFLAVLAVLAGLTLGAASSFAAGDMSSGKAHGNGLNIFVYSRDVPLPVSILTIKQGVVGIGAEFSGSTGPHWAWNIGGGYGIGDVKTETTPRAAPRIRPSSLCRSGKRGSGWTTGATAVIRTGTAAPASSTCRRRSPRRSRELRTSISNR